MKDDSLVEYGRKNKPKTAEVFVKTEGLTPKWLVLPKIHLLNRE